MTSKLAELTRSKVDRRNNLDYPRNIIEAKPYDKVGFQEDNNFENLNLGLMNLDVRIRVRKLCKPLEEDAFRPVLHHYDGPKFRLELSISEVHLLHLLLCGSSYLHYDSDLKFCQRRKQDVTWFT
ncbi:hypothetical protein B296_00034831 [Ensete ventricosum]|uniref:DCD domain-containing protein n=1 Tax=Ensete ventricosum TaxID=4639 RepID=A0A426XNL3_ENSVE|nr:hypothetical protein B296_00034831 [Ensete ventricosum]